MIYLAVKHKDQAHQIRHHDAVIHMLHVCQIKVANAEMCTADTPCDARIALAIIHRAQQAISTHPPGDHG
jgi:hypothetical protein